jgi:hypothetical protein
MPKKGVIEKTEEQAASFLWMPDVVTPFYDILKSVSTALRTFFILVVTMFVIFTYYGFVQEARKSGATFGFALVAPAVGMLVGGSILLLFIVLFGSAFSPVGLFGYPILSTYPNTCPPSHPTRDGLLCYKPCPAGRHRVGDVCWADSKEIGVGTPVGLEKCPNGWENWGLICVEPVTYEWKYGWLFTITGGGRSKGRLDNGGNCPGPQDAGGLQNYDGWYDRWSTANGKKPRTQKECSEPAGAHKDERSCDEEKLVKEGVHTDRVDGMCYKPCPQGMTHIPGMPYLCVKQEADGKPMRLDYYDADSKVPSMVQLFGFFNPI